MTNATPVRRSFLAAGAALGLGAVAYLTPPKSRRRRVVHAAGGYGAMQTENSSPIILPAEAGMPLWTMGMLMTLKATAEQTAGDAGVMDVLMPAGSAPPFHIHHHEAEINYVLDGLITFQCGDEIAESGPGSFVYLPRGVPHRFRVGPDGARMLGIVIPGGLERLYVEVGEPAPARRLPDAPPNVAQWLALAAQYGIEIVGPPLS